jgi:hypothetical protein
MIIQSKLKDYYDFVAHIYGGGDPKNTYIRDYVLPDKIHTDGAKEQVFERFYGHETELWLPGDYDRADGLSQRFTGIVVAGKVYVVTRGYKEPQWVYADQGYTEEIAEPWKIATFGDLAKPRKDLYMKSNPEYFLKGNEPDTVICSRVEKKEAIHLCKRLQAPVFRFDITNRGHVEVFGRCPLLKDFGIPAVLPPEQAYQEISMFRMSVINQSPDAMPRTEMSNVQKVESHGFDKRISFRHRK